MLRHKFLQRFVSARVPTRRILAVAATGASAAGVTLAISSALASGTAQTHNVRSHGQFSVLKHAPYAKAHAASDDLSAAPPGAILALSSGGTSVYALQHANGDVCVFDLSSGGGGGGGCAAAADANQSGVAITVMAAGSTPSMAVLVPDGVKEVTFTRRDGTAVSVGVSNNAAEFADPNLAAAHYILADGSTHTETVPAQHNTSLSPGAVASP
jgi:hypothetical protein